MPRITIKDVAKKCGVSVSTVSRAINDHNEINKETREYILKVINEMGYIPNSNARNLKKITSDVIAVIIKGIGNPFFQPMIKVFEQEINKKGHSFLLYKVEEEDDEIDVALKLVNDNKLKGIIFLGAFLSHDEDKLRQIKVPFIMTTILNRETNIHNSAYVGIDDVEESKKLVNYLIGLGHKKIAVLGARKDDRSIGMLRVLGYKQALEENGLDFDESLVFTASKNENPYTFDFAYKKADEIVSGTEFTAIFCLSDTMAIAAIKKLDDLGYNVPEDYSVVGFDGIEINDYLINPVTTIKQPVKEMALKACKELFNMIDVKDFTVLNKFQGDLFIGNTTREI